MKPPQHLIKNINELAIHQIPFFLFVDFEINEPILYTIENLEKENIFISFPAWCNFGQKKNNKNASIKKTQSISIEEYKKGFEIVEKNLLYGNSFLTNYTCKTEIESENSLSEIIHSANAKYKINYKNEWICFSPETFIQINNGTIYSFPMKGTINAALPNAAQTLLNNPKEIAEHYTIVDLIRNDLSMVATNIEVEKFRYIETIQTNKGSLLQVSSKISGTLPKNFETHLGELLFALLPAGSISGAPKAKTIDTIQQAENYKRGFYTGVAFYFDGKNIDSCVLIRFIEKEGKKLFYKSGGGITIHSKIQEEYQEVIDKIYVPLY